MRNLRPEEEWVVRCVEHAIPGLKAELHDDGSRQRMYDLKLIYATGDNTAAMEVTSATDEQSVAAWHRLNPTDDRWIVQGLEGGWIVEVRPETPTRRFRDRLRQLLQLLESSGTGPRGEIATHSHRDESMRERFESLGVEYLMQGPTDFPGSIYLMVWQPPVRTGGAVSSSGDALAQWVSDWVVDPVRADNLVKLASSGASERHLFVILPSFSNANFEVDMLLLSDDPPLPKVQPVLPDQITHVWVASTWRAGWGFRWSSSAGWERFEKITD